MIKSTSKTWSLVPVAALRQAGFPFSLLSPLIDGRATGDLAQIEAAREATAAAAAGLKLAFRSEAPGDTAGLASYLGLLLPLPENALGSLRPRLGQRSTAEIARYQQLAGNLAAVWQAFARRHTEHMEQARRWVAEAFRDDPALREVLLLSNDASYPRFDEWLRDFGGDAASRNGRKMTDLLTMYLQRVATKNETHSHFGPVTTVRIEAGQGPGIGWTVSGGVERAAFFAHWAGERLGEVFAAMPGLREQVRPWRQPMALSGDAGADCYGSVNETGEPQDWSMVHLRHETVSSAEAWLLRWCDGTLTRAQLRGRWAEQGWPAADFDVTLDSMAGRGLLLARFEVPVGDPYPLRALRAQLPAEPSADRDRAIGVLDHLENLLKAFERGTPGERPAILTTVKAAFEQVTGEPANRGRGQHYADRSILFEECHSRLREFTIGPELAAFLAGDVSLICDLVLLGPRLLMRRERGLLADWVTKRFGSGVPVGLGRLYTAYFADRPGLAAECADFDTEVERLELQITDMLLAGAGEGDRHVEVPREQIADLVAAYPPVPASPCNPDVMFAASDPEALARGEFLAVVGDCHAVREVLTHTSFSALLADRAPQLCGEVFGRYQALLDDDELLCDLARSHPDKSAAQLAFPCPDLEVFGRSAKQRSQVIQPSQLYVVARDGQVDLHAKDLPQRLRLLAPLAGPSIRHDPLAPLTFPRHWRGTGVRTSHLAHVPRIRSGRMVLQRELWRVPSSQFRGVGPRGNPENGDAAEFLAAAGIRSRLLLPRFVFVRVPDEPKPIFVDFEAPLLVRQLFRLIRGGPGGTVEISEMLPAPSELWLDIEGHRYTSELRCSLFSGGRAS